MNEAFRRFAGLASRALGSPWAFMLALALVVVWASAGKYFNYSDAWQLVINTGTTVITFLMVFLIQSTQNRDSKTLNIKLDELLRAVEGARTGLVNLATLSDEDLLRLEQELQRLGAREGIQGLRAQQAKVAQNKSGGAERNPALPHDGRGTAKRPSKPR
ncbi:MAG: low affinity iron permease family protein [Pseudomonadota bacterium]|nr:low affinity iron permease family protein [Pseudomonadota bacterium]